MKVCVLRAGGTNCDAETKLALEASGLEAEVVHINLLSPKPTFDALVVPGGFSYGDHVRAGAILAKKAQRVLESFAEAGKPILGICNGFQVLVEAGLLPGFRKGSVDACLGTNDSARFECRWVHLRHEGGRSVFTKSIQAGAVLHMPVAHSEGKFILGDSSDFRRLVEDGQLVFRYCDEKGRPAGGRYPLNPNGSQLDVAGICDRTGLIFGLMPHPERAYWGWQLPDWTSRRSEYGDGKLIFDALADFLKGNV